jgi:sulfur carrier protein
MTATVNGEPRELAPGTTVAALVDELGLPAGRRGVAVAVDAEVVPRGQWSETQVDDGAEVEVLVAIQGG